MQRWRIRIRVIQRADMQGDQPASLPGKRRPTSPTKTPLNPWRRLIGADLACGKSNLLRQKHQHPSHRRPAVMATAPAMTITDVERLTEPFIAHSTTHASAQNFWLLIPCRFFPTLSLNLRVSTELDHEDSAAPVVAFGFSPQDKGSTHDRRLMVALFAGIVLTA